MTNALTSLELALNFVDKCGWKVGGLDTQRAFLDETFVLHPNWQIAFLPEVDGCLEHLEVGLFGGLCQWQRHWPGPGSFAFGVVFRNSIAPLVRSMKCRGRYALVHVLEFSTDDTVPFLSSVCCVLPTAAVRILKAHFPTWVGFFTQAKCRSSKVYVMGDFNVDQLPADRADPYGHLDKRTDHHSDRRFQLQCMLNAHTLTILLVSSIVVSPRGPYDGICQTHPITRFPIGGQSVIPSRLDYVARGQNPLAELLDFWSGYLADHCCLALDIKD